ncbi:MAG: DNA primase [Nitrospirae bacterium]|nr:DNA primase [Nitrospirota bacterium]
MDRFIPDELIERIREGVDIISVVSEHLSLKKTGQNYTGLCPFHSEKTPSFVVSPTKQIFHCFGCGAGGNVFHFLMKYENLTFPQAVRSLSERAGISIPEISKRDEKIEDAKEPLYKANESAMEFFSRNLAEAKDGERARQYLEKRGIEKKTIQEFNIGYSLPQWDAAYRYLRQKGIETAALEKTGLIIRKDSGDGFYDRFRERLIFPIFDLKKRVIGFGGRVLDDSLPKYINSPESPIYIKGENLYCLEKARQEIGKRGYLLIVEGYLDAIMTYQKGIKNAAATLGTALTPGHLRLIKRFTNNIVLVFDPDSAGKKAAIRSATLFIESGMKAKVASLSEGTDPDTFLRVNGVEAFVDKLKNSEKLLDFVIRETKGKEALSSIDEKVRVADEVLPLISRLPNKIERNAYVRRHAEEIQLDEKDIFAELENRAQKKGFKQEDRKQPLKREAASDNLQKRMVHPGAKAEEMLIHLMLNDESIAKRVKDHLSPDDFKEPLFKRVAGIVYNVIESGKEFNTVFKTEDAEMASLFSALSMRELDYDDREQSFYDCVQKIKGAGIKERLQVLQQRLKDAEKSGDKDSRNRILEEIKALKSGIINL